MNKVAVMTDTVSYMPQELAKEYGIKVVPMHVIIDGKGCAEDEINLADYYSNFPQWKKDEKLPTTSGVPLGTFLEAYRKLSEEAEAIVYIGHSNKLGMTVKTAEQAKQEIKDELSRTSIEVIDSLSATGSQSLIVLEAARAALSGKSFSEVVNVAHSMVRKVNHIGFHDNLYYLLRGGRIHKARPWAASKVTNTALLALDALSEGEIRPAERCKTKGQALEALFNIVRKRSGGNKLHVFINHSDVPAEAEELKAKALSQFSCSEVYIAPIGPVVTVHVGLGVRLFQWWSEG
jgi:DegV family protein with EDD domain